MKHKLLLVLLMVMTVMLFAGCGEDPELARFKKKVDSFCSDVSSLDAKINNLKPEKANSVMQMLGYFDKVDEEFKDFAKISFPERFSNLDQLAQEASEYMTEAVAYYHLAYEGGKYDAPKAEYASENQARAMKRIHIILDVLRGDTPTEEGIQIEY